MSNMKKIKIIKMRAELEKSDVVSYKSNLVYVDQDIYSIFPNLSEMKRNTALLSLVSKYRVPDNVQWEKYKPK